MPLSYIRHVEAAYKLLVQPPLLAPFYPIWEEAAPLSVQLHCRQSPPCAACAYVPPPPSSMPPRPLSILPQCPPVFPLCPPRVIHTC